VGEGKRKPPSLNEGYPCGETVRHLGACGEGLKTRRSRRFTSGGRKKPQWNRGKGTCRLRTKGTEECTLLTQSEVETV